MHPLEKFRFAEGCCRGTLTFFADEKEIHLAEFRGYIWLESGVESDDGGFGLSLHSSFMFNP
jgi:hypothetical protein